nr:MAG TPA: hypothetical protein [Caudoviricetes sp.]
MGSKNRNPPKMAQIAAWREGGRATGARKRPARK